MKKFLATKLRLKLLKRETVVAGDIAANYVQWSLSGTGPDGEPVEMGGVAAGVFRRQSSGEWKIVIDNPLGTGILD